MAPESDMPTVVKVDDVWQIEGKPRERFEIRAMYHPPNLPGKTIVVGYINIPPNGGTPSHRHGGAAVIAIPVSGYSLNQMNGQEPKIYGPGDFLYEAPGCHHQRSDNPGEENAIFFAVLVVDDEVINGGKDLGQLVVLDKEVETGERKPSKCVGKYENPCCE
ncbi:hypothetical protein BDV95DRAFT_216468 [Massariosphaeria phaeospora]|uniref:Cupin type-2 domain-containing protein n=1 Tax=Massariosphaeria phaeospora TaxID=100035 RepID=A0A7C8MF26_9PLEO|nr:hypothetical protein BDV95DRAFT_216468 [Massariosphaeria phaeospora]